MIQVNRIYLIFNRLVTKKFLVDTSVLYYVIRIKKVHVIKRYFRFLTFKIFSIYRKYLMRKEP